MTGGLSDLVWTDILGYVQTHHSAIARGWFAQLQPGALEGGELTIHAANDAQLSYLTEHCLVPFIEATQAATGRLVTVSFAAAANPETGIPEGPSTSRPLAHGGSALPLTDTYTFENFVVGPCNRLAHASCVAVSDSPGTAYNPLFLHGSAGLGKTHLLQAVCHKATALSPAVQARYLSCETFVNQFIEAVERGALEAFRHRSRHVDFLLIDDVQFLAGREGIQEEFFHTFNTLYQLRRQIVLSADRPPAEIPSLEERLISRFNWGLVARIDPPDLETRLAIIKKKTRMLGIELPEDAALCLGSRVKSNTRELEGALNRIHGLATLEHRSIDLALVREALGDEGAAPARRVRIQDIMSLVTERFNVKLSDLHGRRRSRSIALPRQVGMYLARKFTGHSLEEIGGFFGGRDHTTVLHASKLIGGRREVDLKFRAELEELEAELTKPT